MNIGLREYIRACKRCGNYFKTPHKKAKICLNCYHPLVKHRKDIK